MNIYVGNLPWSTTDDDLREMFESYGTVDSASVISDRETGRSRGFGFVEMPDADAGTAAIQALNETDMGGRNMVVNEARPRGERSGGGGGDRRGGGGGGGGYRGGGGGGGGGGYRDRY
jgi:RNA recognition motif-containing protein